MGNTISKAMSAKFSVFERGTKRKITQEDSPKPIKRAKRAPVIPREVTRAKCSRQCDTFAARINKSFGREGLEIGEKIFKEFLSGRRSSVSSEFSSDPSSSDLGPDLESSPDSSVDSVFQTPSTVYERPVTRSSARDSVTPVAAGLRSRPRPPFNPKVLFDEE